MSVAQCLFAIALIWSLLFFSTSLTLWVPVLVAAIVIDYQLTSTLSCFHLALSLIALVLLGFAIKPLRAKYFTKRLYKPFQKILPTISATEQAALDAGDIWWEGDLFKGLPNWDKLTKLPIKTLTDEEQNFLDNQVNQLCGLIDDWDVMRGKMDLSDSAWQYIKQEKFFGLIIPKESGGLGFSAIAHSQIISKIASRSISAAVTVMVPNSLGPAELLLHYGAQEQKDYYLPRLAKGEEIPCFALTGPEAGSDAGAMPDTGVVCRGTHEGQEVLGIKLNWDKRYITLAPVATVMGLAFKLFDPDGLLGDKKSLGITLALIPTDHPGIEIGDRHIPANCSFMNGPIRGQDVFIPMEWIIGGQAKIGQGWRMLMECLAAGRGISLPALSYAATLQAYRTTSAYALVRKQFKVSLGAFEGVQASLGRMGAFAYLQQAVRTFTVSAIDDGYNPAVTTAITKYHLTEIGRTAVIDAMDIQAGKAIMNGPNNYLASFYQSMPVAITVEGANILTRNLIIFGQGAIRCHPYLTKEIHALSATDEAVGIKEFDDALFAHIGYSLRNFLRALTLGLTNGWYSPKQLLQPKPIRSYLRKLSRFSTALAFVSDIALLVLGGELKRKENLSARLGDVLSHLYLASAVINLYQRQGSQANELPYVQWVLQYNLYSAEQAFKSFFENFPNRLVAYLLKWTMFPFGFKEKMPKDKLGQAIATDMLSQSQTRNSLVKDLFISKSPEDAVGLLEMAYQKMAEVAPLLDKLTAAIKARVIANNLTFEEQLTQCQAQDILSIEEVSLLAEFEELRKAVIRVDEFKPESFS